MVSPFAIFSALLVAAFTCSLKSSLESNVIPSHFMVLLWVTMMSPSGPGRVMSGKSMLCFLVKCASAHLMKSIERSRPCRMCSIVTKSARRAATFCSRLVEEV